MLRIYTFIKCYVNIDLFNAIFDKVNQIRIKLQEVRENATIAYDEIYEVI